MLRIRLIPLFVCTVLLGGLALSPSSAFANLKTSIERLDSITGKAKVSDLDTKLLNALGVIDKMPEGKKWEQVGSLIDMREFTYSRYYDELLYLYMAHAINNKQQRDADALWSKLRDIQTSVHIFPTLLIRYVSKANNRTGLKNALDFIKLSPANTVIHGPVLEGNLLFGYKLKEDFSQGPLPKTITLAEYKASPVPLEGFSEENQYVALLENLGTQFGFDFASTRELAELYARAHEGGKASQKYFMLAESLYNDKRYAEAKTYIDLSMKNKPNAARAAQLKNDIELALILNPDQKPTATPVAAAPETGCNDGFLFDHSSRISARSLKGKNKKELRLMRNEIFARHGRGFKSEDLHAYFTSKCWYSINPEYSDQLLSQTDRINLLTIQEAEN